MARKKDDSSQSTADDSQCTIHDSQLGEEECGDTSQCTTNNSQLGDESGDAGDTDDSQCTIHNSQLGDESRGDEGDGGANSQCSTHSSQLGDESRGDEADGGANSQTTTNNSQLKDGTSAGIDKDLSTLEIMLAAERDKYLRLAAEYDNYRKRSGKEREATYATARADTITRLLPVYDNLERALKMECSDEAFFRGVEMMMTQLTGILEGMDVRLVRAVGETFDPNRHNAVMSVVDPALGEKVVAEEYQKGFMLGERVIRHSTVVVAN